VPSHNEYGAGCVKQAYQDHTLACSPARDLLRLLQATPISATPPRVSLVQRCSGHKFSNNNQSICIEGR
jgi:hypothetical protein